MGVLAAQAVADAQPLGTFQWTLQPYCNVVTVNVTQQGSTFLFDGWDDQCGASRRAPVVGTGSLNPDGTMGIGLTIVTTPSARALSVDATLTLPAVSGTWRDSQGHTGVFAFGVQPSGVARPAIETTIGAADILAGEVQRRIANTCGAGEFFTGVAEDGTAACAAPLPGAGITGVAAGSGLTGGASSGLATLSVAFAGSGAASTVARSDHTHAADITAVTAGAGLVGGASSGAVTISADLAGTGSATSVARSDHTHAADITGVTAGSGLTGGASSGAVTLAADFGGSGAASTVARSDHQHSVGDESNVALGSNALAGVTTIHSVAIGGGALESGVSGYRNVGVGFGALRGTTTGNLNVAVGGTAAYSNVTGLGNVAIGDSAMFAPTADSQSVAIGYAALMRITSGGDNTGVGAGALQWLDVGFGNIGIGVGSGGGQLTGDNNIIIGNWKSLPNGTDNTIHIGNGHTRAFLEGIRGVTTGANDAVPVVVDSNGQLGTVSSSARTKHDVADLPEGVSARLRLLRPVQFRYNQAFDNGEQPLQYGLIAEEVQQVLPELVAFGRDGQPETVKYHVLPALLLAEVQRLSRELASLRAQLAEHTPK